MSPTILLITNSARGEAIADAFVRSPQKPRIIACSTVRSPGLVAMCDEVHVIDIMDFGAICSLASAVKPSFCFIAPDDPIGGGLADELEAIGFPCIAPKASLARIESSKGFTRELMEKYGIHASPKFRVFTTTSGSEEEMRTYMQKYLEGNYVVKYDALKGGKGVKVSGEHLSSVDEGVAYAQECIDECGRVVIEEKLIGQEFSLLSFATGIKLAHMPAVQDHKRAFEGDTGPNTGGMGTYSDAHHGLPFLNDRDIADAKNINEAIAAALQSECKCDYRGILYGGFIATKNGVKVIEFNARFGDPEALNVLPLLTGDFVRICQKMIDGTLTQGDAQFEKKATVCLYITPKSYPDAKTEKGQEVIVPNNTDPDVRIYYGDVTQNTEGKILLGGSRSIGVVGLGASISEAHAHAEKVCEQFKGPIRYRRDIGTRELLQQKIDQMKILRGK